MPRSASEEGAIIAMTKRILSLVSLVVIVGLAMPMSTYSQKRSSTDGAATTIARLAGTSHDASTVSSVLDPDQPPIKLPKPPKRKGGGDEDRGGDQEAEG